MVEHAYNPSTGEAETAEYLGTCWSAQASLAELTNSSFDETSSLEGTGEMTQWLRALTALAERSWVQF